MKFLKRSALKRRASAGWSIAVVFLGLILFAFIFTELTYVGDQVNAFVAGMPSFTASYDPATNSAMDSLFYSGLAIMVAFGAVVEIINVNQKRSSGEEVI